MRAEAFFFFCNDRLRVWEKGRGVIAFQSGNWRSLKETSVHTKYLRIYSFMQIFIQMPLATDPTLSAHLSYSSNSLGSSSLQ